MQLDRRDVLRGAIAGGAVAATLGVAGTALAERSGAGQRSVGPAGVSLRWLGVAGWEISFDGHVLYFDPYLSRFNYQANGGALAPNPAVIDGLLATGRLAGPPELIMLSHGHFDHLGDIPTLLGRPDWDAATIRTMGSDTNRNLLAAFNPKPERLSRYIEVTGGEDFDFGGGAYRVQVIRSLHSQSPGYGFAYPGYRGSPPSLPANIADLVEGGTLAYQVTIQDRLSILLFGGTNFIERELAGLRPDVVMVCMTDFTSLHKYLERLLTVLGGPRYVIPAHHDDMITSFDDPNLPNTVHANAVQALKDAVKNLRLRTRVLTPAHLKAFTL
jgi:L-ascorbate metabolism protein UlaG (beta-lactamase superfamily)